MRIKNIISLILCILLVVSLLYGCDKRASLEADIKEYDEKISSLNDDLKYYQDIYDEAMSTYQQYNKHKGNSDWDAELLKTKEIIDKAQSKISSIKRDIALYKDFKESLENQLKDCK